uniref:Endonuclease III homolog n=1 Tax=Onchocerca volvulus TaxID=6282 RepID=A0A8R1TR54_ONCVO
MLDFKLHFYADEFPTIFQDKETGRFGGLFRTMATPMKKRRKAIKITFDKEEHCSKNGNEQSADTEESPLWMKHLENIKQMRSNWDAPVDSMGCHMLADALAEPKVFRFQTLLSLMLSSQTKDHITAAAMHRLRTHGCTVDDLIVISTEELQQLLIPVGFYKKKAIYIKKVAEILKEHYDGDIPNTVEGLCSLPGVGEKMAYLAMHTAWDQMEGLGVDTHVHRISNRLGWIKTSNPKESRIALEALVPREQWQELNKLLVGFGQQMCLPILPKCSECLNKNICAAIGVKKKR